MELLIASLLAVLADAREDNARYVRRNEILRRLGLAPRMHPWTSGDMPLGEARKLARWWDGYHGYSAEIQRAPQGRFRVHVW